MTGGRRDAAHRPVRAAPWLGLGNPWQLAAAFVILLACIVAATRVNGYYVFVLANVALMATVGIGLNLLIGLTGQVSFGHVGFYAIGAYAVAILTTRAGFNFWLAWPLGMVLAGAVGYLLAQPALRVKGPYLAMVTIAFGFIVEHAMVEMRGLTGGQNGLMNLPRPALPGLPGSERTVALVAIVTAGFALMLFTWITRGTWGAAMRAVRDSETAAESIGLNPLVIKTVAFAGSAALAGLAGGLFAPLSGFVTPSSFAFLQSILFVLVVMIGGAGSIIGPIIGAVIVGLLPEMLASLEEYRLLFFGGLLLVVLWAAPDGVAGLLHRVLTLGRRRGVTPTGDATARSTAAAPTRVVGGNSARPLHVEGLSMTFGGVRAVSDLTFDVAPATVIGLIGPNGAGKTTALNMLSGFYRPTSGTVVLGDEALQGRAAFRVARNGVARTYQTSQLFGSLGVVDNVALAMGRGQLGGLFAATHFRSATVRARSEELLAFCGYRGPLDARGGDLPHVDRRLVEIARALATRPAVLLLDEPAAGLSQEDKAHLATLLRRIADTGIGVVLVEHDMGLVMEVCDRLVVLDAGQRLAVGTPDAIRADPAVRLAYLGESTSSLGVRTSRSIDSATESPELLGVGRLTTGYGAEPVLRDIDLQVRRGELVALLGANGAGKSTLMRALAGLQRPVRGGITFAGRDLVPLSTERIVALGLVLVPEGRQVFPDLSVQDNLRLGAFLRPQDRATRIEAILTRFPRLRERLHQRAGLLSGGEQQMLAIGRGLLSQPTILLLDEPSLGLAPLVIRELFTALDQLRADDMTILLVDQMAALALALADRAYVIESGRIVGSGPADDIAQTPALAKAYLGH